MFGCLLDAGAPDRVGFGKASPTQRLLRTAHAAHPSANEDAGARAVFETDAVASQQGRAPLMRAAGWVLSSESEYTKHRHRIFVNADSAAQDSTGTVKPCPPALHSPNGSCLLLGITSDSSPRAPWVPIPSGTPFFNCILQHLRTVRCKMHSMSGPEPSNSTA